MGQRIRVAAHQVSERLQGQGFGVAIGSDLSHQHLPGQSEIPSTRRCGRKSLIVRYDKRRTTRRRGARSRLGAGNQEFQLAKGEDDPFAFGKQVQLRLSTLKSFDNGDLGAGVTRSARNSYKITYRNRAGRWALIRP